MPNPTPDDSAVCVWSLNSDEFSIYKVTCLDGDRFELDNNESLKANDFKYCPFCGKPISESNEEE